MVVGSDGPVCLGAIGGKGDQVPETSFATMISRRGAGPMA